MQLDSRPNVFSVLLYQGDETAWQVLELFLSMKEYLYLSNAAPG